MKQVLNFRSLALAASLAVTSMVTGAMIAPEAAQAETRTLDIYFTHTKERKKITFKRNGRYVKSGLRKLNRILRDHRRKEPTRMDPKLLDLVWSIYKEAGGRKPIHVISGYRSPKTNAMLRRRGRKTARKSQHMRGKALDWFIPGVSISKLRAVALKQHGGGVGYYRNSFIHTDTARVRHWPRMSRRQLARVFPRGRTIHVPSNGRPLKGYKVALANIKRGRRYDGRKPRYKSDGGGTSLLARLFRRDDTNDESETVKEVTAPTPAPRPVATKPVPAAPVPAAPTPAPAETQVVAAPPADRGTDLFAADAKEANDGQPVRIARAIVPTVRPGTPVDATPVPAAIPATVVASADPARPARRPGADLNGTPPSLEAFSVAELRRRGTQPAQVNAYARPETEVPGVQAAEALAAGQPVARPEATPAIIPASAPIVAAPRELALADPKSQPFTKPVRDIDGLNRRIRSSFTKNAPVATLAAPKVDDAIVTAALNTKQPIRSASDVTPSLKRGASKASLPVPGLLMRTGDVVFVRLSAKTSPAPFTIGNLYSRSVKSWATARTTRRGAFATLRAPAYGQSTRRPAPDTVYASGFQKNGRQRTDAFTGTSLLKVRYRELAALTQ